MPTMAAWLLSDTGPLLSNDREGALGWSWPDVMVDYSWGAVESRTREWLEARLREGVHLGFERREGVYDRAGQPQALTAYHFQLLQRKIQILRLLDRLAFESFVDVGSGFEYYPRLVRERYGAAAFYVDFNHHANLPFDGFPSDRLDHAVTASLARLPFPDAAFGVVLCSEVLEHLVRPVEAIAELRRIARRAVIVTSLEAFAPRRLRRWWLHYRVDVTVPHVERNFLSWADLRLLFGENTHCEALLDSAALPAPMITALPEQEAAYRGLRDRDALVDALVTAAQPADPFGRDRAGILAAIDLGRGGAFSTMRPGDDRALAAWVVDRTAAIERQRLDAMERYAFIAGTILRREPSLAPEALLPPLLALAAPPRQRAVSPELLTYLCCPDCGGRLASDADGVRCATCAMAFVVDRGVPVLYPHRLPDEPVAECRLFPHLGVSTRSQRRRLRRLRRRLSRNERPAGRLRRAVWALAGPPR